LHSKPKAEVQTSPEEEEEEETLSLEQQQLFDSRRHEKGAGLV
jgi:hypothetical protein